MATSMISPRSINKTGEGKKSRSTQGNLAMSLVRGQLAANCRCGSNLIFTKASLTFFPAKVKDVKLRITVTECRSTVTWLQMTVTEKARDFFRFDLQDSIAFSGASGSVSLPLQRLPFSIDLL